MANNDTPEILLGDPNAKVFYILNDGTVQTCAKVGDLPYHKQRSSYISAGVFSPQLKKVSFWGDAHNPQKCLETLVKEGLVDKDYSYTLSTTRIQRPDNRPNIKVSNGIARHGTNASFSRFPATGRGNLVPQGAASEVAPAEAAEAVDEDATVAAVKPRPPKIEIRTANQGLQKQPVQKQPRTT